MSFYINMTEIETYFCNTCIINYSLWTHNKLKHDGILTEKSTYTKKEYNCKVYNCNCSKCTKVYRKKQTKGNHEKKCDGKISISSELIVYDKKIIVLEKENENIELHIKLQELNNVEIVDKIVIFQRRELCPDVSVGHVTIEKTSTKHFIYILSEREFLTNNVICSEHYS
jgi:hypothetical protein